MSDKPQKSQKSEAKDYSKTLFLPQTEFPMRAGLPQREPELLKYWNDIGLYDKLRQEAQGRAPNSCCMTARPTPMATSISGTR
ncbi:hypothetical protein ACVWZ6_008635 [Bradyrhizobium sp. GM6.1]